MAMNVKAEQTKGAEKFVKALIDLAIEKGIMQEIIEEEAVK